MSIDFFQTDCQEETRNDIRFGICDNQNGNVAYTDNSNSNSWIAEVDNSNQIDIQFTAIDNCIEIKRKDGTMDNCCDGMLTYQNNLVFVELKNQTKNWISYAIKQLETTIIYFLETLENENLFKHKRAFASNKKHPHFHHGYAEKSKQFFNNYRFRLHIEAKIVI